ncbi:endonuclease III [Paraneptunicella aestuarii]|uniref:endonuclease III n=1 Tax=Paraneptunicella aestuarii TaxID=2831148 RepID=UPI001E31A1FB|nr:endonuclease III [Paraneptunicella aestuarii]UAA37879.1 endonuclease III [Paraneptunicella aestuarii]
MNKQKRIEILTRLRDDNPHPTTELNYSSPFELLIAVILSAQATDVGVNKATDKLFPVANTPEAILELGLDGLKDYIKTIGLFNAKAENVMKTCQILVEQHNSEVPENREALEALPGVGRKTANVVLNTAFGWLKDNEGRYFIAVDTHIQRLANRTGYAKGKTVEQTEQAIIKNTPNKAEFMFNLHHWFILHGRYVCTARNPKCGSCIIEDLCEFKDKTCD